MSRERFNNLFISTTFAPTGSRVLQVVQELIRKGITNIELGSTHKHETNFVYQLKDLSCRFLVHNYFPIPKLPFVLNIASADNAIRSKSVGHIFNAIDFSQEVGAELYTFHPGFLTDPSGHSENTKNYDFKFEKTVSFKKHYEKAFGNMIEAVSRIVRHAGNCGIKIAIETEGSVAKKNHLLMQHPEEFKRFFTYFSSKEISVNLNLGHMQLAANSFNFDMWDFIDLIKEFTVAVEISHNDGRTDQHLPVEEKAWYWDFLQADVFDHAYKILEFRNTPIEQVLSSIALFHKKL